MITSILEEFCSADTPAAFAVVPEDLAAGKLYEAYIFAVIARHLAVEEGYDLRLVNGNYLALKAAPGPINRSYPFVELRRGSGPAWAEMWTDVEFGP